MSGFKDDVISILKQNGMYHKEAIGLIKYSRLLKSSLVDTLQKEGFPVTEKFEKFVIRFDYIVLGTEYLSIPMLLSALSHLSVGGLLVLELNSYQSYKDRYTSLFGNFSATKVKYDGRQYLVIRNGADYGN